MDIETKGYAYRYIIKSASITNDSKTIFSTCNGLNNVKRTIIHGDEYKTLGVANLDKITNWTSVKESSNWVGVTFFDGNYRQKKATARFPLNLKT